MSDFIGQKLKLENICNNSLLVEKGNTIIENYNLIISTTNGTIDTTNYNLCKYGATGSGTGVNVPNIFDGSKKVLYLAKKKDTSNATFEDGDSLLIIVETSVIDIKIKSRRDFMKNQIKIVKKI